MLTQEKLKEVLTYNPDTGIFTWLHRESIHFKSKRQYAVWNKRFAEKNAGAIEKGYIRILIFKQSYRAHRLAWLYQTGYLPIDQIDHIDGNRSNNSFSNLREANNSENQQNLKACKSTSTTGFLGVINGNDRKTYRAKIAFKGKTIHLGTFSTPESAHDAYVHAKKELHNFSTL